MTIIKRIDAWARREWILLTLLALTFALRIVGIGYGLPLTVVSDEQPFTLGALQMLNTKTLVPSFNEEAFSVLYYPPYMSYVLLLPFVAIIGVQWFIWQGSAALFTSYLLSDLTAFFVVARFINIILSVISVYLLFRTAEALFKSRIAAVAASLLLATSILHEALSMVGRHWLPVSFFFILVLFVLTRTNISLSRRYLYSFLVAGVAMGFSSISALAVGLIGLYYLLFDAQRLQKILHDLPRLSLYGVLFAILAIIPSLLHSKSNGFIVALTLFGQKTLEDFLASPWATLSLTIYSEPVLTGLFIFGLFLALLYSRRILILIGGFFLLYIAGFYVFFRLEPRFLVPLLPLYALAAGYCVECLWNKKTVALVCVVLLLPLVSAVRFSYLVYEGDTRDAARTWLLKHLKPEDKVLIHVSGLRLPATPTALEELRAIDPGAIRRTDEAEAALRLQNVPHALNLVGAADTAFIEDLPAYASSHGYTHLVFARESMLPSVMPLFSRLAEGSDELQHYEGFGSWMSSYESAFLRSFLELLENRMLGPDIVIYRLPPKTSP